MNTHAPLVPPPHARIDHDAIHRAALVAQHRHAAARRRGVLRRRATAAKERVGT